VGLEGISDATTAAFDFLGFFLGGSTTTGSASTTGAFLVVGVGLGTATRTGGAATGLVEGGVGLARGIDDAGKEATTEATWNGKREKVSVCSQERKNESLGRGQNVPKEQQQPSLSFLSSPSSQPPSSPSSPS